MIPWFKNVQPHKDIREGHLDESIFAANLSEVASGSGREVYSNAELFFQRTYLTAALKNIAKIVIQGLNGGQVAENRVISLQTGFGGGKTHTLITLYHLAKSGERLARNSYARGIIEHTGRPAFNLARVAVFTNTTNDAIQGRKINGYHLRTIWGELAYQLGGEEAYEIVRLNDEARTAPKGLFKQVLEKCKPALILIDELADYCISASAVNVGNSNLGDQTISFMQELTEAVSGVDQSVMIATLPASDTELGAQPNSAHILTSLESRITRVGANMRPVEDEEVFEVVRRRLFDDLGDENEIESVLKGYAELYQGLFTEIPGYAVKTAYKEKLRKSYPFHPELIDIFRLRWASNHSFQRTRGVLRILASIVSDLWKRQNSLTGSHYLIHTSDVVLSNVEAVSSQITSLNGIAWDAVMSADVSGGASNAFRIDSDVPGLGKYGLTQGLATTILMGTFGTIGQNKGLSISELKLFLLKPDGFNHNDINGSLDKLESSAHYLYYNVTGEKRYWFDTTPNLNILINQAKGNIKNQAINAEILNRLKEGTRNITAFNVLVNPSVDITEQSEPTLIILDPSYRAAVDNLFTNTEELIKKISTKKGNRERIYRNTLLFLVCSDVGFVKLQEGVKNYLASLQIKSEYSSQLTQEQRNDIQTRISDAERVVTGNLSAAFSIIVKYSDLEGPGIMTIAEPASDFANYVKNNILKNLTAAEWLIESVGLNTLRVNNLLPTPDKPVRVKDIYEAFLRFDDKPMITGKSAVANSLQRYCFNGEFCIAAGDGTNFSNFFLREEVPLFEVSEPTYWLTDVSLKPVQTIPQPGTQESVALGHGVGHSSVQSHGYGEGMKAQQSHEHGREIEAINISGKVAIDDYHEILSCFISPFVKDGHLVDIEIKLRVKSNPANRITESKPLFKSAKESAKQLGLAFEEE